MKTQVVFDSLPPEQQEAFMATDLSQKERKLRNQLEEQLLKSSNKVFELQLRKGKALEKLRDDPRLLWQRHPMFKTKSGAWKKNRP